MDLISFSASSRPALLRAFGSHVIARNEDIAAELIARFGLPSVTLDGNFTSVGTLQGGWRGCAPDRGGVVAAKMAFDAAMQALVGVQREIAAMEEAMQQAHVVEEGCEAAILQQGAKLLAEEAFMQQQQALAAATTTRLDAEVAMGRVKAAVIAKQSMLAALQMHAGSGEQQASSMALASLAADSTRYHTVVKELSARAAASADAMHQAGMQLTAAQVRASSAGTADGPVQLRQAQQALQGKLAAAKEELARWHVAVDTVGMHPAQTSQQISHLQILLAQLEDTVATQRLQLDALQQSSEGSMHTAQRARTALQSLRAEVLGGELLQGGTEEECPRVMELEGEDAAACLERALRALRHRQLLLDRVHKLGARAALPVMQRLQLKESEEQLSTLSEAAATLKAGGQQLEEGMRKLEGKVHQSL
jgi:chromosome segregation ATPase